MFTQTSNKLDTTTTKKNRKSILGAAAMAAIEPLENRTMLSVSLSSATNLGQLNGETTATGNTLYKFTVPLNDVFYESATGSITLYNNAGNALKSGTGSFTDTITAGTYYAGDATAATHLTLLSKLAGSTAPAGESIGQMDGLTKTTYDFIGNSVGGINTTADFYRFRLVQTNNLTFTLAGVTPSNGITLQLYSFNTTTNVSTPIGSPSTTGTLSYANAPAGQYALGLTQTAAGDNSNYALTSKAVVVSSGAALDTITDTASATSVQVGTDVTFTVTVDNTGTATSSAITLSDPVPSGSTLVGPGPGDRRHPIGRSGPQYAVRDHLRG